jgi:hypothetical protein
MSIILKVSYMKSNNNNGQFQVWELNIWLFIVFVETKYFLNLNEYYVPIFILSIHFRQIPPISIVMTPTIVLCECRVQWRYLFFVKLCFDNTMSIIMKNPWNYTVKSFDFDTTSKRFDMSKWVIVFMPSEQFFNKIMTRTNYIIVLIWVW